MIDARWYMILKEFENAPTIEPGADLALPKHKSPRDSDDPNWSRKLRVGLVVTTSLLAAILIAILPTV